VLLLGSQERWFLTAVSLDNTESEIKYIATIIMLSCNVHTVI